MNGLVGRLIARARGGPAAAALPLVRPIASVYSPAESGVGLVEQRETGPAPLARSPAPTASLNLRPGSPQGRHAAPRTFAAEAPADSIAPAPDASPLQTPPSDRQGPRSVNPAPLLAPPLVQRSGAEAGDRPGLDDRRPPPVEPVRRRAQEVAADDRPKPSPGPWPAMLEQITETIFAEPPAPQRVATLQQEGPPREAVEPTLISIGRIEIQVAEPPPSRAPSPRTRGFQAYARLRRGLER